MDFDERDQKYKQVKEAKGGGTRNVSIEKDKTIADIKDYAEALVFPQWHV